jgi:phosphoenolpyruvate carboxykinase (ATP)
VVPAPAAGVRAVPARCSGQDVDRACILHVWGATTTSNCSHEDQHVTPPPDIGAVTPVHRGSSSRYGLDTHGIERSGVVHWNYSPPQLIERAIAAREGVIVEGGAFNALTAPHTGRSPRDRFLASDPQTDAEIWWGAVNRMFEPAAYNTLREELVHALERQDLFVRDMWAGAAPEHRISVRIVTPSAWHNLFSHNIFRAPASDEIQAMRPDFTVLHDPEFQADPARHGTRTGTFIILNLARREVLIGGTRYAGEIKKSVFAFLNHRLPKHGVLPMHCSVNVGESGDPAAFFGLSGTGKTTLSADPERHLVGDDEHGWDDNGVFNFEGGCYAKVIRLSAEKEPEIHATTRRFGTILENVVVNADRTIDLDSDEITENTRACYPLSYIPNFAPDGRAGHPRHVVFLTADAYGILPPIARLTPDQAIYHFLSGYTAKLAGTETGVSEPKATFSACFGAPFLPLHPIVYAEMLREKIERHQPTVWLVNTGWTGGPYGEGRRIDLTHTRAMLRAALDGRLHAVPTRAERAFGLHVPEMVPDVPADLLQPRNTWPDGTRYDSQAPKLAHLFRENFAHFAASVTPEVRQAGPAVE